MRKTHVRVELLDAVMQKSGLVAATLAARMRMDRTTVYRARSGKPVGEEFIAGLLSTFPDQRFEDLFFVREMLHGCNTTMKEA